MKKSLDIIKKTIKILNSVSYENYSDEKVKNYLDYIKDSRADEDRLISPVLLRKFLEQILGFELGKNIATQESRGAGKPDYIPVDTRTHPFVFDAKGIDTQHLSQHYPQIRKYIESQNLKYGILTNMRDLEVYTSEYGIELEEYNFNFIKLYRDYKENPKTCLERENTKRFLNFVRNFSYIPLTKEQKIEKIAKAKPWTGKEELNVKSLTNQLKHIVNILHNNVKQQKSDLVGMAETGKVSGESIAYEIEEIFTHISGKEIKKEIDGKTFNKIIDAEETTFYGKARDAFFRRVAYFAMTRLLLARVWEDIGFVDEQCLYNGGFAKWYENFNHEIKRVLHYAFDLSAERYPWLFKLNNNYSWYEPSDNALIDSLYELSNFYLGKLNQDILGTIYEDYIEKVDKKNKGQYYTPREIVSFIWDRVGFNNPKAFFWHTMGKRRPNLIFDPAAGSGGFLVEAARRIRECSNFDWDEPQDLKDIHNAILWGIFGCEISLFPYYLTQVNLLVQLTPIIRKHIELTGEKPRKQPTPLGVISKDSLELHNKEALFETEVNKKKEKYNHEIIHFTIAEKKIYEKIKEIYSGKFSFVCANPPYVGEKGHKELFRQTLNLYPYWKRYYQGKMDYLYWFIILGLSKLRQWGKLGFITTAYWPTANGSSKLRKYILENAKIKEMIFFEGVKIFEHAKGQHNMVFILTKCSGKEHKEERENNHIKIVQVKCKNQDLPGNTIREDLDYLTTHIQKHIDKPRYKDKYIKVFWSGVKQGDLNEKAWNLTYDRETSQTLKRIRESGEPLGNNICNINQGVVSGVPKISKKNIAMLPAETISKYNLKEGKGIFVLTQEELKSIDLNENEIKLVKPYYKSTAIDRYFIDNTDIQYLLYITKDTNINHYPNIKSHLEKFRPILEERLRRWEENYPWFKLHREREQLIFENEKIVTPNFARWNTFSYISDPFYTEFDVYFITKKDISESLQYITGILNSRLIDFWIAHKSKKKGEKGEIRVYNTTSISAIPIHRIKFDNPKEVKAHNEIVEKVKVIRERMSELSKYSKFFNGIRLTRLPFDAPLPKINVEVIIKSIAGGNLYNLRTHPEIIIEKTKDFEEDKFYLSKVDRPELILTRNAQIKIKG